MRLRAAADIVRRFRGRPGPRPFRPGRTPAPNNQLACSPVPSTVSLAASVLDARLLWRSSGKLRKIASASAEIYIKRCWAPNSAYRWNSFDSLATVFLPCRAILVVDCRH
jgi:hypothetical protein